MSAATAADGPRPVMRNPDSGPYDYDEDGHPLDQGVGWDLAWGCRVSFSNDADGLSATVSMSDEEQRRGIAVRAVTADQIRDYAHKLLALAGEAS